MLKVGFIGLGTMGSGMAANIQKAGFSMTINDLREDNASPLLAAQSPLTKSTLHCLAVHVNAHAIRK